jgi:hypothetical protein
MPLSRWDVSNLNQSISGLGEAFAERSKGEREQQRLDIEKDLRERQLDVEKRRMTAEEGRQKILGEGSISAYLVPEDAEEGSGMTYQGPPSGLAQFQQTVQQKTGKALKQSSPPDKTPPFGFEAMLPSGKVTFHARTIDELKSILNNPAMEGAKAPLGATSPTSAVQTDTAATALENQADELERTTPEASPLMTAQVTRLRQRAQALRGGTPSETVTRKPAIDPKTGAQKVDAQGMPVWLQEFTTRNPKNTMGTATAPPAMPLPADKSKMVKGQKYSVRGEQWTWDGEKLVK